MACLDIDDCWSLELSDPIDRTGVSEGVMNDDLLDIFDLYRSSPQKSPVRVDIASVRAVLYVMG